MKQKVNPMIAVVAVIAVVLVAGLFLWKSGSGGTHVSADKPPGMPGDVAKEFQQRMGSTTGSGGTTGPGTVTATPGAPPGGAGGYIVPPPH